MNSTTAYNAAISSYQAAATSLQNSMTIITYVFAGLLAFITLFSGWIHWRIKKQSDSAEERMKKASTLIKEAEKRREQLASEQKELTKLTQDLLELMNSKEVTEKLHEINGLKKFMEQTKERMYCEDYLTDAKRLLNIIRNNDFFWKCVLSKPELYGKYELLFGEADAQSVIVKLTWDAKNKEENKSTREECERIYKESGQFFNTVSENARKFNIQGNL
jgi:hypothetical protein